MKKLLLILLCLPIIGFGQVEIDFNSLVSIKKYYENNAKELEGVWKYAGSSDVVRIAFVKKENIYNGSIIENSGKFKKGDLKASFEVDSTSSNIIINLKGYKKQDIICQGTIMSNQLIQFTIPGKKGGNRMFIKEYPLFDFELYDENLNISNDVSLNLKKEQSNELQLQDQINKINFKMELHHKQFFNGAALNIIGLGLTTLGAIIGEQDVVYLGSGFSIVGTIIGVRSHKWFKKNPKGIAKKRSF
mgnify:FL=1